MANSSRTTIVTMTQSRNSANREQRPSHKCERRNSLTHQPCNVVFSRASSLKRHVLTCHDDVQSTTFVFCVPSSRSVRSVHSRRKLPRSTISRGYIAVPRMLLPAAQATSSTYGRAIVSASSSFELSSTFFYSGIARAPMLLSLSSGAASQETPAADATQGTRTLPFSQITHQGHVSPHVTTLGDLGDIPMYDMRQSRRTLDQPKALYWLTQEAKLKFDKSYETILTAWGRTVRQTGTCLLVPKDWRFSNPLNLMALFNFDNVPSPSASRAWYSFADHGTFLIRVMVWFSKSSRTNLDLDVFLDCAPYKSMDASHLCHHEHCIVHVVYEPADINLDRLRCCRRARFLRTEKRPVLYRCEIHDPSCMMQVEIYYLLGFRTQID